MKITIKMHPASKKDLGCSRLGTISIAPELSKSHKRLYVTSSREQMTKGFYVLFEIRMHKS